MIEIPEYLKTAFSDSAYKRTMEHRKTDFHYQQLEEEYTKLLECILSQLDEEHRNMMFQLEEVQNEMDSIDDELIYWQGMADCAALLRAIRLI